MADPTTTTPAKSPSPAPPPVNPKQALYEAFGDVMRQQAETREAERAAAAAQQRERSRVSPIIVVGVAILALAGGYVAVEQPTWLFPPPVHADTREEREAGLRIGMATAVQQIERYRQEQGRLPSTLSEAGSTMPGITYTQTGRSSYLVRGINGPVELSYRSSEPLRDFVGDSYALLARRTGR
jgi:hypothetical protein